MMAAPELCSSCGEVVPEGSPLGLCPRCCLGKLGALDEVDSSVGPAIPGFEVVSELGAGAFGEVFECLQFDPAVRRVAVKVAREGAGGETRLREEAQVLADLDHEGIPRLLGAGELPDGRPFFAMELFEGQSLEEWWQEGRSIRTGVKVLRQVAETLAYAHGNGVVHRDLKPANILVAPDGEGGWKTALIDFGVARASEGLASVGREATVAESLIGTPVYMAPEQLAGEDAQKPTVDVHALGLLLGEFLGGFSLLGKVIRSESSWAENLEARRKWSWPLPTRSWVRKESLSVDDLEALGWVGERATAFEASERYAGAGEVAKELGRWLHGEALEVGRGRFRYRVGKVVRKQKRVMEGALVVVAMLVFLGNLWFSERTRSRQKLESTRRSAVLSQQQMESDRLHAEALRAFEQGRGGEARKDLDEALRIWPQNAGARFAQQVLNAMSPPAKELSPLLLPFVAREVWAHEGGGWLVQNSEGQIYEVKEGEEPQLVSDHPAMATKSSWQGEDWLARVAGGGVLEFVKEGDAFPLMEAIVFSEGENAVAVDVVRKRVAATTNRKELARWDIAALGSGREEADFGVRTFSMSMDRGTGDLWILDQLGRLRGWALNEEPGFALSLGLSTSDFEIQASVESYSQGLIGGARGLQFLMALEEWKRNTGAHLTASAANRDGRVACFGGANSDVLEWSPETVFTRWPSQKAPATAIAVGLEGAHFLWAGSDGVVTFFERKSRVVLWEYQLESQPVAVTLLDSGEAVVACRDGTFSTFSSKGELLKTVSLVGERKGSFKPYVYSIPGGRHFLAGISGELVMRSYDALSGKEVGQAMRSEHGWELFFLSVDGKFLIALDQPAGEGEAAVKIWSMETFREVIPAIRHPGLLDWVCFSTDNSILATASQDGVVRRWSFAEE